MRNTVRLGRVAGVPLGVNWSLLVVAGLLAYLLGGQRLPAQAPGYRQGEYALAGILTAIGLFVSVLAHEMGHAVVARRHRLPVDGITLSWIGGVTRIDGEAAIPRSEALLAAAGPFVSLALGGLLWLGSMAASSAGAGPLVVECARWLAVVNLMLGLFNLVPAAPLDGGRILHALAWRLTGDRWRAGKAASAAGMAFGGLVILAGGFEASRAVTGAETVDALMVGAVGWWLISVARSERHVAAIHRVLDGSRCADVMRPVLPGPGWVTVDAFLAGMPPAAHAPSPVWMLSEWGDEQRTSGVVTSETLAQVPPPLRSSTRVVDVAIPVTRATAAGPWDDLLSAISGSGGAAMILVVDDGRTVGAVVPSDLEAIIGKGRPVARVRPAGTQAPAS